MTEEKKPPSQETPIEDELFDKTEKPVEAEPKKEEVVTEPVKKEEPKKEEPKTKEPERIVPEKYELTLPEGSHLAAEHLNNVSSESKEAGRTNEEAQAIVERDSKILATYVEGQTKTLEGAKTQWIEDVKNDKEIGGEAVAKNAELSKRVIERYGTPEFKEALVATGLGNHPELVRVFVRIGKLMSEDQLVLPGAQGPVKKSLEDTFYPNQGK